MIKYYIEQINVSDSDYLLTSIYGKSGDKIKEGDLIFSYESSKADYDVESNMNGYLYFNPNIKEQKKYKVGVLIAIVSENEITDIDEIFIDGMQLNSAKQIDANKTISKKALKLIEENNIDVNTIEGEIINEEMVLNLLNKTGNTASFQDIKFYYEPSNLTKKFEIKKNKKLAIIGAGKAALQLLDAVIDASYHIPTVLYDNNEALKGKQLLNIPIKPLALDIILADFKKGEFGEIIISFSGNINNRKYWFDLLKQNHLPIANVFHPTCHISNFVEIGVGNIFFAFTRIGPFVEIGDNNVVSSYCSIEHHNVLGNHNTFGPSVIFSGSCTIGSEVKFGTGIFIEPKVKIGNNAIISSGCIVQRNIPNNSILRNNNNFEIKPIKISE